MRAVVLDADGTLWDTRCAMEAAGAAGVRALWPDLTDAQAEAAAARFRADRTGAFRRFVAGELDFPAMRGARLADVAARLGRPWEPAATAAFEAVYAPVFETSLRAYADTAPFLDWCASRGLPVRVLTNSSQAYTEAKVDATGLTALTGVVCSRDCLGVGKPEQVVFAHVCAVLGVEPSEVLFVGDEWISDALGAADAGLAAAWLVRDDGDPAQEVVATPQRRAAAAARGIPLIGSLTDVPALLAGDLGAGGVGG